MPLITMLPFLHFACAVIVGVILLAAIKLNADVADGAEETVPPPMIDLHEDKKCAFYPVETKMTLRRRQRKLGRTVGNKRRK